MKIISKRGRQFTKRSLFDQATIIQSCTDDPVYFLNNYYYVPHPVKIQTRLTLHPYQEDYIKTVLRNKYVIAVMPRNAGTTCVSLGYLVWNALFHANQNIIIGAIDVTSAAILWHQVQHAVTATPPFLRPVIDKMNVNSIELKNGSCISIRVCSGVFALGMNPTLVYLDNFAYALPKIQHDTFFSLQTALAARKGSCIIASTPNGLSNTFANVWSNANTIPWGYPGGPVNPGLRFTPFKKTAVDMPQYNVHWENMMKKALGESAYRRDYGCEFT
jgi:hypothetical protein